MDAGEWGETVRGGRSRLRRRLPRIALAVGALLLLVLGTYAGAAVHASGRIERVDVGGLGSGPGPRHILVTGSDSREGLTPEQQRELTAGQVAGARTDTIFVLSVDGDRAGMLAFPRDLYVTRCDGTPGRINTAFQLGGPDCLVRTISELSGLPISHYMSVDFLGFRDIVDAVGGVDLCLERAITDPFAGVDLPAGCQTLDGRQALGYVRVRRIDSDLERIKRQQQFLHSLASAIASPGVVLNLPRLYRTAGAVGAALTADPGLGTLDLLRLARALRGVSTGGAVTATVPTTSARVGGAAVLRPVEGEAQALFASFRDGSALARAGSGPAPADIRVAVRNGAGVDGLASRTADLLRSSGFDVVDVGNHEPTARTVVVHPPGAGPAAEVVARALPLEPELREDAAAGAVTLILGEDARGLGS